MSVNKQASKKGIMGKTILRIALVGLVIAGFFGYQKYTEIFGPAVPNDLANTFVEIPSNSNFEEVAMLLQSNNIIQDKSAFTWLADQMKYKRSSMRAGRFEIEPGWSNYDLIRHLRGGKQSPVNVVFNHAWTVEDAFMSLLIPNTYQVFWNTSAEDFVQRMVKEHKAFWKKNNRLSKAETLGLTPKEVYTLASIVERETRKNDEKKRVAGVYYNRLKTKGWRLEADPTVKYATGDFGLRRILNKHLEIDSPYNTYKYPGLPPGPISMASIASIDAVLNVEDHQYMFFCAKGDGSGYHNFAKTLSQHNANAAKYRRNMRKSGAW